MSTSTAWDKIIKWFAALAGAIAGLFGGWDTMLQVLVGAMVIDYLTGWIVAILGNSTKTESGHLSSEVAWRGLLKKGLALLVVLLGTLLDKAAGQNVFRSMAVWFYIANEGLSILENLALAGVPFPRGVMRLLEQMKDEHDDVKPESDHPPEQWPEPGAEEV